MDCNDEKWLQKCSAHFNRHLFILNYVQGYDLIKKVI